MAKIGCALVAEVLPTGDGPNADPDAVLTAPADVLVVGAGLSGARMCQLLRAEGFGGRIVLVGDEPDLPYDRPPLTSQPGVDTDLARTMDIDVRALADEVHVGLRAVQAEADGVGSDGPPWTVTVADGSGGRRCTASVVVAATGASPIQPVGWDRASVLHTRPQADRLWGDVSAGTELVIVGGGWIGCEVARTAAARGAHVVLLEAAGQLLPGRIPAEAAARVAALLTAVGVDVRVGQPVTQLTATAGRTRVETPRGAVTGDVVLAALGVRPQTSWLPEHLPRSGAGAVLTDPWGRTPSPGLFALGDAAARWSPRASRHLPGGHWTEAFGRAQSAAPAVVSWLAGEPSPDRWRAPAPRAAEDPIPYTFSDLGGQRLLVLGNASAGTPIWREQGSGWTVYVLDEHGLLAGVVALDRPRDAVAARTAMRSAASGRPRADPTALADPQAPAARCFPKGVAVDSA